MKRLKAEIILAILLTQTSWAAVFPGMPKAPYPLPVVLPAPTPMAAK